MVWAGFTYGLLVLFKYLSMMLHRSGKTWLVFQECPWKSHEIDLSQARIRRKFFWKCVKCRRSRFQPQVYIIHLWHIDIPSFASVWCNKVPAVCFRTWILFFISKHLNCNVLMGGISLGDKYRSTGSTFQQTEVAIKTWLVVWTPLKNMIQLGWWHSQYMGK